MKRRYFLLHALLFTVGCTTATNGKHCYSLKDGLEKLRFAVSDVVGMKELERDYGPFRTVLEKVLKIPVEFFPVRTRSDATAALKLDRVDLVWAGPSEYLTIHARTNTVPLVGISRPKTRVIFATRADSNISSVEDLQGKTIEMGPVGVTLSHLLPVRILLDAGLDPNEDVQIMNSEEYELEALQRGDVDAWARPIHRYRSALKSMGASEEEFPIFIDYGPIPPDVLVASNFLDPEAVAQIRECLIESSAEIAEAIVASKALASKFEGAEIVEIADPDYDAIRAVYQAIGQGDLFE